MRMTIYNTIKEAIDSIGYGMCSYCEAEHEFPNVKCELMPPLCGDHLVPLNSGCGCLI
jgi:hypothetical protein